jgi:hypothetical protein
MGKPALCRFPSLRWAIWDAGGSPSCVPELKEMNTSAHEPNVIEAVPETPDLTEERIRKSMPTLPMTN